MSRFILGFVALMGLSLTFSAIHTSPVAAAIAENEDAMKEMVLGNKDARVTVIEYASLGCPHCANFHSGTFVDVKRDYIDTGKIKFIYRDFPLGRPALAAAMIARCAGSTKYFGMIDIFFRSQQQWSRAENPLLALTKIARFGGMSEADVTACLQNQELLVHIQTEAAKGETDHKINATPSFVINGETISGGMPYEKFKDLLDKALNKSI